MRRLGTIVLVALLTAVTSGCRTPPRKDLVEAELRVKDQDLRELRGELERSDAYNQYLQRELRALQGLAAVPPPSSSEPISPNRVKNIILGRQTGGVDDDGIPGDEALQVVVEPRDSDNHSVKAPGSLLVQALEVTPEGTKKPLSAWNVDAETLRKSWRTGLFGSGYTLTLPWRTWPSASKVRVVVQFIGQDERVFEADRDVVVRLAPEAYRKMPPVNDGPALPGLPREGDVLPPPRRIEPEKKDEVPMMPPAPTADVDRPLRGAVEILRPVVPN